MGSNLSRDKRYPECLSRITSVFPDKCKDKDPNRTLRPRPIRYFLIYYCWIAFPMVPRKFSSTLDFHFLSLCLLWLDSSRLSCALLQLFSSISFPPFLFFPKMSSYYNFSPLSNASPSTFSLFRLSPSLSLPFLYFSRHLFSCRFIIFSPSPLPSILSFSSIYFPHVLISLPSNSSPSIAFSSLPLLSFSPHFLRPLLCLQPFPCFLTQQQSEPPPHPSL